MRVCNGVSLQASVNAAVDRVHVDGGNVLLVSGGCVHVVGRDSDGDVVVRVAAVVHGLGFAPLPPIAKDFVNGMGRTNDSIIYGGVVQLMMRGSDEELNQLSKNLPSNSSKDYGKPFKEIFESYNMDFYKIDGSLFSPAIVIINSLDSGKTFRGGHVNEELIKKSFF